jgi:lambda family phage minor tail protein L
MAEGAGISRDVVREILAFEPSQMLEFYAVYYDWPNNQSDYLAFSPMSNGFNGRIIFQGQEFLPIPMESEGYDAKGSSELSRPKITLSNKSYQISKYLRAHNNLIGAKIVRKRTFAKFLDNVNFPNGENPYASKASRGDESELNTLQDQVYYISRRVVENKEIVQFELSSVLEMENVYLPNRNVYSRFCPFIYRGYGCRYKNAPVATVRDKEFTTDAGVPITVTGVASKWDASTTYGSGSFVYITIDNYRMSSVNESPDLNAGEALQTVYVCKESNVVGNAAYPPISDKWIQDECSKTISGCALRFGNKPLRFGGFPGTYQYPSQRAL